MMNWTDLPKVIIRVEMTKRGMTYADLVGALGKIGVVEDERNLRNKIARSTFSASFLLQCLVAMDHTTVDLGSYGIPKPATPVSAGADLDFGLE
jgi:hypothetical protein